MAALSTPLRLNSLSSIRMTVAIAPLKNASIEDEYGMLRLTRPISPKITIVAIILRLAAVRLLFLSMFPELSSISFIVQQTQGFVQLCEQCLKKVRGMLDMLN